jgi:hypothetical protein
MAYPVYVLLPADVEWSEVPGTTAQAPAPIRWYLRRWMPAAATQVAVLVEGEGAQRDERIVQVASAATDLGGMAIDATTQLPVDAGAGGGTVVAPD